jgi:regulator of replication initiation timing
MKKDEPIPPTRTEPDRGTDAAVGHTETVENLRDRIEKLEAEREALLEENRALRRELTQLRLLSDMEKTIEEIEEETGRVPAAPPPAEDLYALLPSSFAFPVFFQIAESRGLDTAEARRCLLHFLAEDRVVREGSRLVKHSATA